VTKHAVWRHPVDVRASFPHADTVGLFTVFNIGGNKYRLVSAIKYRWQVVYIRNILTHAEYDEGKWKL
jgi:mRNA interferase HigB